MSYNSVCRTIDVCRIIMCVVRWHLMYDVEWILCVICTEWKHLMLFTPSSLPLALVSSLSSVSLPTVENNTWKYNKFKRLFSEQVTWKGSSTTAATAMTTITAVARRSVVWP